MNGDRILVAKPTDILSFLRTMFILWLLAWSVDTMKMITWLTEWLKQSNESSVDMFSG